MPNSQTLIPKPGILDIALYQSGASALPGQSKVLKLSANENPLGPSRAALGAVQAAAAQMHRYPTTDHAALRNAIGAAHGLDPEQIICGVGSDEVLQFLAHAYAGPGDEVIYTEHGFSMYPILARMVGAKPVMVPEAARVVDVGAILAGVTARTKIVYLTNPGNPTATILPDAEVARLAAGLPGNVVLVIDGAYAEYVSPTIEGGRYDSGASLVQRHHNVIMTRTFSKIYGLGGLRIGWGYAPREMIDVLNRLRQPFNLSVIQLAAALAAVQDQDWVKNCAAQNAILRGWLCEELRGAGVGCDESHTNFLLARFADKAEADACNAALNANGILVRKVAGYGLPNALRLTVGDEAGCARLAATITKFMEMR